MKRILSLLSTALVAGAMMSMPVAALAHCHPHCKKECATSKAKDCMKTCKKTCKINHHKKKTMHTTKMAPAQKSTDTPDNNMPNNGSTMMETGKSE